MKKLILIATLAVTLTNCSDYSTKTPKDANGNPLKSQRIHLIEETSYSGTSCAIIEVNFYVNIMVEYI